MVAFLFMMFVVVVSRGQAGYLYPKPSVPFELPIETKINSPPLDGDSIHQIHKVAVSYSVPLEDFQFLKQFKSEYNSHNNKLQLARPFSNQIVGNNEGSLILDKLATQSANVISNVDYGRLGQVSINDRDYDRTALVQDAIKQTESISNNQIVSVNGAPTVNQLTDGNQPAPAAPSEARVTKHIYFHVPPPDVEESPVYRVPEPPKKIYKIIFIKVPSQRPSYNVQLQQMIRDKLNQNALVEDKTLIYVLVKKPEPVEILPPPAPTPSTHEVLFVKYNENEASAPIAANDQPSANFPFIPSAAAVRRR